MVRKSILVIVMGLPCLLLATRVFASDASGPVASAQLLQCLQGSGAQVTQTSNTAAYDADRQVWNEKIQRSPSVIVYATTAEQVQQVVKCGKQYDVNVSPRSGGHSYEGYSVGDGTVLLDVSGLDSIKMLDTSDAIIGGGIKLGPLYLGLWNNGNRVFPAGVCPGVGAGGHLTGGGVGMLGRKYGLASDQILSVDMVDANGDLITADAANNTDLLFASQGGGSGSLGIITSFTIRTFPAPATTTVFATNWDISNTMATLSWWQAHAPAFPNELASDFQVYPGTAQFAGLYLGPKQELLDILNSAGYGSLPSKVSEDFEEKPYINAALQQANLSQGLGPKDDINSLGLGPGTTTSPRSYFTAKSQIASKPIAADGIQQIIDAFAEPEASGYWQAHAQQGAIGAVPSNATAYPHRDAIMIVQLMATWTDPSKQSSSESWLSRLYTSTQPYVDPNAAYINYIDADQPNWAQAYWGSNLAKLQEVKSKYDPDNFWNKPQGIPLAS